MRVLVADDHALFRDGIISLLEAAGFEVVGQANEGEEAVRMTLDLQPDLVLMDFHMPSMDGLEALKAIKASASQVKVVILTVSEDDAVLVEAVKSGADGYLFKHLHADEFLEALQGLEHGEAAITRKAAAILMKGLSHEAEVTPVPAPSLTNREYQVLELVAKGLPNKEIAAQLGLSENTIKYHVKNILQKSNTQNRTEAVSHAIHNGWIETE